MRMGGANQPDNNMKPGGSRLTLILNLCALAAALVVTAEMHYIDYVSFRIYNPSDAVGPFIPALVMFIIRRRIFSVCFLLLYAALAIQMFFQAYDAYSGIHGSSKMLFAYLAMFCFVSIFSLAIYAAGVVVRFAVSRFARSERNRRAETERI
jgi:hypothetical protein